MRRAAPRMLWSGPQPPSGSCAGARLGQGWGRAGAGWRAGQRSFLQVILLPSALTCPSLLSPFLPCSSASSAGLPTSPDLLAGLQQAMALLQQPASGLQGNGAHHSTLRRQDAFSQLVTALVHALQGVPPGDAQLRAQAEAAVQQQVLQPLAAALAEVQSLVAAGAAGQPAQLRAVVWRLQAALQQYQALLNGLEAHAWYDDASSSASSGNGSMLAAPGAAEQEGVAAAAVAAFLACWPLLAQACDWVGRLPAAGPSSGGLAAARRDLYHELAHCMGSCISLDQEGAQRLLPSFADTTAACFFLPGAHGPGSHLEEPSCRCWARWAQQLAATAPLLACLLPSCQVPPC